MIRNNTSGSNNNRTVLLTGKFTTRKIIKLRKVIKRSRIMLNNRKRGRTKRLLLRIGGTKKLLRNLYISQNINHRKASPNLPINRDKTYKQTKIKLSIKRLLNLNFQIKVLKIRVKL
jgi:hypothetical protein